MSESASKNAADSTAESSTPKKKTSKKEKGATGDIVSKFQGEGLIFKGKLYGTADVQQARGDVMCQKALQLLKAAVKTNSQHKQKIVLKINIDGVTIVDAVANQKLHEHQVSRISFISRDSDDNRSFCYVVGGNDGKHVLYGVKTEKPSEMVLLTLRDLFQAVYELQQRGNAEKRASRSSSHSSDTNIRTSFTSSNTSLSNKTDSALAADSPMNIPVSTVTKTNNLPVAGDVASVTSPNNTSSMYQTQSSTGIRNNINIQPSGNIQTPKNTQTSTAMPPSTNSQPAVSVQTISNIPGKESAALDDLNLKGDMQATQVVNTISSDIHSIKSDQSEGQVDRLSETGLEASISQGDMEETSLKSVNTASEQAESANESEINWPDFASSASSAATDPKSQHNETLVTPKEVITSESAASVSSESSSQVSHSSGIPSVRSVSADNTEVKDSWVSDFEFNSASPFSDFSNIDPFAMNNSDNIASDNTNPWGTTDMGTQEDSTDPWASFNNVDHWSSSNADTAIDNAWGGSDPWADSPFTPTEDSRCSDTVIVHDLSSNKSPLNVVSSDNTAVNTDTSGIINEGSGDHAVASVSQPTVHSGDNSLDVPWTNSHTKVEQSAAEPDDPFAGAGPVLSEDPFADEPLDISPFSVDSDAGFAMPVDPFSDIDPFASSTTPVESLKVDSDPFFASGDQFSTELSFTDLPSELPNITGNAAHATVSARLLTPTAQPISDESHVLSHSPTSTTTPSISLSSDTFAAAVTAPDSSLANNQQEVDFGSHDPDGGSEDDSPNLAPPSCPPPMLPPELVVTVDSPAKTSSAVVHNRAAPPAIPVRRRSSGSSPMTSQPASKPALPPVPSRSSITPSIITSAKESLESTVDFGPPELPPPSLPPPAIKAPQLPQRPLSVEPPKIPERKPRKTSEGDKMPLTAKTSVPLSLAPSVQSSDC